MMTNHPPTLLLVLLLLAVPAFLVGFGAALLTREGIWVLPAVLGAALLAAPYLSWEHPDRR